MSRPRPLARHATDAITGLIRSGAALPRWVFRALSIERRRSMAVSLARPIRDLRPQAALYDFRYDG